MPAPTYTLPTSGTTVTKAAHEAAVTAGLATVYNYATAGLNAGAIVPIVMTGGTVNAMTGDVAGALAETTLGAGDVIRFLAPGVNTSASPVITITETSGAITYEIRSFQGGALPAGALRAQRYLAVVTATTGSPQVSLLAPIQITDIPSLDFAAYFQRGTLANGTDLNTVVRPGTYFLAASGGYTGMPTDALATSAHWLEVRTYGLTSGLGSGRFVLQRLTSMATVLPGGPGHVYRPTFERRLDSDNPADATNVTAWLPVHAITPLAGKRVVCLGDSITQGGGGWDWPAMLAGLTGANVTNGGFGGCRMGQHSNALFDPFSMYRVAQRIEDGNWAALTAAADTLFAATGDDRRPAAARLAALDWSTVDYIVISYGTNDFGGEVPIGADSDTTGTTFKGAINTSIARILATYPRIQILFATPLWRSRVYADGDDSNVTPNNSGVFLREYVQAIKTRAKAYQIPVTDLYDNSGISILNWTTMMPDGLHPWSVPGVERVATMIAGALSSVASGGGGGLVTGISDVPGLQDALNAKAATSHTHTIPNVTGLQSALDAKASVSDLANKADTAAVTAALADKADAASVATALADKADVSALASKADAVDLAAKADTTALTAAIATREPVTTYPTLSGASTNLVASNAFARLRFTNASPTLTIQLQSAHAYPADFGCSGYPDNATGQMTITAPAGVTLRLYNGDSISTETSVTVGAFSLIRTASDSWVLIAGRQFTAAQLGALITSLCGAPTAGMPNVPALTDATWGWARAANTTEARASAFGGWYSPANVAAAAAEVDRGSVSGVVTIDPEQGINQFFTVTGDTRFTADATLAASDAGYIRVRLDGAYSVSFDALTTLRDDDVGSLAPDPRPWLDTVYHYRFQGGRLVIKDVDYLPIVSPTLPTFAQFSGAYDPGILPTVGANVTSLTPVGGTWSYINSSGVSANVITTDRNYTTTDTTNLPVLVDLDGRRGIRFAGAGNGLKANLLGIQSIGIPSPTTEADAMPYRSYLTWGAMIYLPSGGLGGSIGGVFRQENSNTAIMSAIAASDGTINGNARLATGAIRQVSSAADVAANLGVHSAEVEAEVGKWVPYVFQVQITSINTAADTDPPTTTTRGAGATWRMWLADGLLGSATTTFSSYRGSANVFGFRANRSALGIIGSGGSLSTPGDVTIGRHFVTTDDLSYGSAGWRALMRWLGGV